MARLGAGQPEGSVEGAEAIQELGGRATKALHGAININDQATSARVALQEEVNRTKRVARHICASYHRKAALTAVDKSKLMYLI